MVVGVGRIPHRKRIFLIRPFYPIFVQLTRIKISALSLFSSQIKFNNISLPPWLSRFFLLCTERFGDLFSHVRIHLTAIFGRQPTHAELVRPTQMVMPIGFKRAVFVGHAFTQPYIRKTLQTSNQMVKSDRYNVFIGKMPLLYRHCGLIRVVSSTLYHPFHSSTGPYGLNKHLPRVSHLT